MCRVGGWAYLTYIFMWAEWGVVFIFVCVCVCVCVAFVHLCVCVCGGGVHGGRWSIYIFVCRWMGG